MLCKVSWKGLLLPWLKETQSMTTVGIDVSKRTLSCAYRHEVRVFPNDQEGHKALKEWAATAQTWCMEATGRYHLELANFAARAGKRCLVVNPGRAKKYLSFVDARAKTDKVDALALERMAEREGESFRAYQPVPAPIQAARDILVRRRALVETRVSLDLVRQSAGDPGGHLAAVLKSMEMTCKELEKELAQILKEYEKFKNLLSIPGIGPMSASLLVCALERGEFLTSDSLVAFAGLDPRANDSGKHKGQRRLSHQGDAQLRTTLFMAAKTGSRLPTWKPYYQSQLAKGLSSTEATIILARKMLRVAWSVYRHGSEFRHATTPPLDKLT